MNLRSLTPFQDSTSLVRPEANPFGSLQREIDRVFDEFKRGVPMFATQALMNIVPSVDVAETEKEIEITAELPGLEREDVEISLEDEHAYDPWREKGRSRAGRQEGQELPSQRTKLWRVLSCSAVASGHRSVDRQGDVVERRLEGHHPEAGPEPSQENRGQGSRLTERHGRDVLRTSSPWSASRS